MALHMARYISRFPHMYIRDNRTLSSIFHISLVNRRNAHSACCNYVSPVRESSTRFRDLEGCTVQYCRLRLNS